MWSKAKQLSKARFFFIRCFQLTDLKYDPHEDNEGSYECKCLDGFQGDGFNCVDVEECFDELHDCGNGDGITRCINTIGSFYCECNRGWIMTRVDY